MWGWGGEALPGLKEEKLMKVEMEPHDIDVIASRIVELLKPILLTRRDEKKDERPSQKKNENQRDGSIIPF